MAGRIVLFGATGYTGDLAARALVARGARPVLAARNEGRVRALAEELGGLEHAVADVARPDTVRALVERGDVLLTTVGPFLRWGRPALDAAIGTGAHYIDSTGEGPFIRDVFEVHGGGAQAAGCALVTACAYDWVPGNLAGALALREAPEAVAVHIGYFARGMASADGMSGGTRASSVGVALDRAYTWRDGHLTTERPFRRMRTFDVGGRSRPAISLGTTEAFSLPRVHPGLREVDVYLGWFGPASRPLQGLSAATALAGRVPGFTGAVKAVAGKAVKGSTGGPDAEARAKTSSEIVAEARDAAGHVLAGVRLTGVNGYTFTAEMLAWAAIQAASGELQGTGALGPVEAFGLDELEAGVASAGLTRA